MSAKLLLENLIAAGLTQVEIARRIGCTANYLSMIRAGRRGQRPGFEFMSKMAELNKELSKKTVKRR
jgi:transcriptional regulator with XRE-family HTH domain